MLANVLSLLQGPCFHFIFTNHPCFSVICVSLICTSPSLLAFYFRFTVPAFVLYLLHHLSIRFILASRPLDSYYPYFTIPAIGLVFALPYLHSFYFCFTITTFVLKTEQKSGLCPIKYGIWKTRNKHIDPAVLGSLKRHWGWHLLKAPYNLHGSWLIHLPQNSLSWRDVPDICPGLQNSIRFRHVFAGVPTQSRR